MIKRCDNQHYYDSDKFPTCPFCKGADMKNGRAQAGGNPVLPQLNDDDDDVTVPLAFYQQNRPSAGQPAPLPNSTPVPQTPSSDIPAPIQTPVGSLPYNKLLPPLPLEDDAVSNTEPTVPAAPFAPQQAPDMEPTVPAAPFVPQQAADMEPTVPAAPFAPQQAADMEPTVPAAPPIPQQVPDMEPTVPAAPPIPQQVPDMEPTVPAVPPVPPQDSTADRQNEVVGWLVALSGAAYGESFELKGSQNVVSVTPTLTVCVGDGNTISNSAALVTYAADKQTCRVVPCGQGQAVTVNGEAVTGERLLAAYDRLVIGEESLLFFPL